MKVDIRDDPKNVVATSSRVWLDDEEVTTFCFSADEEAGVVGLYQRAPNGGGILRGSDGKPMVYWKHGKVRIDYGANYHA